MPEIQTAFSIASRTNLTLKELEELEKREMFFEDQRGAVIKGMQEGRKEGRQEGRQEGLIEGQTALILRLLARRTGEIPPETKTRIQQLSLEQLDDLGEILLDFTSQEDLIAWLESVST
jgi:predicted transposase YdaD